MIARRFDMGGIASPSEGCCDCPVAILPIREHLPGAIPPSTADAKARPQLTR